jgi:hypothetical protein
MVVRHVDRAHFLDIDPRPDDMAMLAPVLDMKDHGARLTRKAKAVLDGRNGLIILLAGIRHKPSRAEMDNCGFLRSCDDTLLWQKRGSWTLF